MDDPHKPFSEPDSPPPSDGVEESSTPFVSGADQHRLTLEALEEYRRTGESVDAGPVLDAFVANVRRRVADKR